MKNRLFVFANDAASANVTIAYTYLYGDLYDKILAYPSGEAINLYNHHIPNYISYGELNFNISDTVVTGTSGINSSYELNIIKKAKNNNIAKSIMIIDNTSNFNMRFSIKNELIKESDLADEIWIFEKYYKSNIDYINQKVIYKENIYNTYLKELFQKSKPSINHPFIKVNQDNYLVILTEYIYELYGLKFGFTEYDMLEYILNTIDQLNITIPIFLKLHPREHKNKFNILLRKYSHLNILKDEVNIQELIYYSKLVCGINSSVFIECSIFHKPAFSIQINSKNHMFVKNLSKSNVIYSTAKLRTLLLKYFKT